MKPYQSSEKREDTGKSAAPLGIGVYLLLGPVTGALVGFTQTLIGIGIYCWYDQPEGFYFRGLTAAKQTLTMLTMGGAIFGLFYGILLLFVLGIVGRTVRPVVTLVRALFVIATITLAMTIYEFETETMFAIFLHPLSHQWMATLVAFVTTMLSSRKKELCPRNVYLSPGRAMQ